MASRRGAAGSPRQPCAAGTAGGCAPGRWTTDVVPIDGALAERSEPRLAVWCAGPRRGAGELDVAAVTEEPMPAVRSTCTRIGPSSRAVRYECQARPTAGGTSAASARPAAEGRITGRRRAHSISKLIASAPLLLQAVRVEVGQDLDPPGAQGAAEAGNSRTGQMAKVAMTFWAEARWTAAGCGPVWTARRRW